MMKINAFLILLLILLLGELACKTSEQKNGEQLKADCCKECLEAFSQSPVGVGAEGVNCGAFTSAKPLSKACVDYFEKYPMVVSACE